MKCKFLLTAGLITSAFAAGAQDSNKGYAITGNGNRDMMWMNIRQVDLATGKVTKTIYDYSSTKYTTEINSKVDQSQPLATFVAAAAYDRRTEKLFFVPMRLGQLRWMDASAKGDVISFHAVDIPGYTPSPANEEANNVTRMVIAADNFGYAIDNEGSHLYRFTTGKKPSVTDLGSLVDAEENKGMSVHNRCSSWGGDMIADAYGKLYIISASRNVFVVDVNTRITTYKGAITGLPGTFTTNGAAVDADGNIVLSSALNFDGYYKMSIADLAAKKIEGSDVQYSASDLAGGNLLLQKEADQAKSTAFTLTPATPLAMNENLVYPNPVTGNSFNLLLDRKMNGNYTVVISDLAGRSLQSDKAGFSKGQQSYRVNLRSRPSKGTYLIKVYDENNNVVLSDKVMVL